MRIDFGSLSFNCLNYTTDKKTNKQIVRGNAAWTTAVSKQSGDYKYNAQSGKLQEFQPILFGMVYCSIPVDSINISIGKGGNKEDEHEFILASMFDKSIVSLYINRELVEYRIDYPFLMLLTKAIAADRVHCGTQMLRFGDTISLKDGSISNVLFFQKIREKFGMGEKASWVIEEITVDDQDTLHLYGVVVDKNNPSPIYENAAARKIAIRSLRPDYPKNKSNTDSKEGFTPVKPTAEKTYLEDEEYSYIAAIKTKPFLILGGFSGTGKSQKVKELAFATCPCDGVLNVSETSPGNYLLVSVKPNWHDATDITGFRSSVNRNYYVTDFMRFLVKAKQYEDKKVPFFVCLDEMNLAPVEEYFADFLSVIESRKRRADGKIVTDAIVPASVFNDTDYAADFNIFMKLGLELTNPDWKADDVSALDAEEQAQAFVRQDIVEELKHDGLTIPSNVIIIGTVNMDDTTNSFSRKVIDRAMTFETIVGEFGEDYFDSDVALHYIKNPRKGELFLSDEVRATQMLDEGRFTLTKKEQIAILGFINGINEDLEGSPFKISYRILNETILLYRSKKRIAEIMEAEGGFEDGVEFDTDLNTIFDEILMQKVLPRIEGDYEKCNKCLTKLSTRAEDNDWLKSSEKIEFMIKRFGTDKSGFTTFWN